MAASTSTWSPQINTPLPNAKPSAFTTQRPFKDDAKSLAAGASENVPARAVGIPYFAMKPCENAFDDSNCAALRFGPQIRKPLS